MRLFFCLIISCVWQIFYLESMRRELEKYEAILQSDDDDEQG